MSLVGILGRVKRGLHVRGIAKPIISRVEWGVDVVGLSADLF